VAPPRLPLEEQSFDELLALVSHGELRSGRGVSVASDGVEPLTPPQLERLAAAADLAESEGAGRALMLIDGRALILEVASRTLSGELDMNAAAPLVRLDAAVYVAGDGEAPAPRPSGPRLDVLSPLIAALRPQPGD
jgi:hypothetical protein